MFVARVKKETTFFGFSNNRARCSYKNAQRSTGKKMFSEEEE